jgi:hypothetical protein
VWCVPVSGGACKLAVVAVPQGNGPQHERGGDSIGRDAEDSILSQSAQTGMVLCTTLLSTADLGMSSGLQGPIVRQDKSGALASIGPAGVHSAREGSLREALRLGEAAVSMDGAEAASAAGVEPVAVIPTDAPSLWVACSYDNGGLYVFDTGLQLAPGAHLLKGERGRDSKAASASTPGASEALPGPACNRRGDTRIVISASLSTQPVLTFSLTGPCMEHGVAGTAGDTAIVFTLDYRRGVCAILREVSLLSPGASVSMAVGAHGAATGADTGSVDECLVCVGGWDGSIHLIDATRGELVHSCPPPAPPCGGVYAIASYVEGGLETQLDGIAEDTTIWGSAFDAMESPQASSSVLTLAAGFKSGRVAVMHLPIAARH